MDLELRLVPPHPKGKAFGVVPMSLYPHKANQVKQSPAGLHKGKKKTSKLSKNENHTKKGDEKRQFHSYRPKAQEPEKTTEGQRNWKPLHRKHFALRTLHGPGKDRVPCLLPRGSVTLLN